MISNPETSKPIGDPAIPRSQRAGRMRLLMFAKIAMSAILLAWLLSRASLRDIFASIRRADVLVLLVAYSLDYVGWLINTFRWDILLRALGTAPRRSFLLISFLVATFFNNFLPSTVGGDASRAYDCYRHVGGRAMSSVLIDRLLGLLVLIVFALISLPLATRLTDHVPLALWLFAGVVSLLLALWLIFFGPSGGLAARLLARLPTPIGTALGTVWSAVRAYRGKWRALLKALALSVLLQANVILYFIIVAWALDLGMSAFNFFLIVPLASLVMLLPISINGIGLRENTFAAILAWYGVATADAVAFAWLAYLGNLQLGLLGGIALALRR